MERSYSALRFYEPLVAAKAAIDPSRRLRIARAYQDVDLIDKAVESYTAVVTVRPKDQNSLEELARLCYQEGRFEEAAGFRRRVFALYEGAGITRTVLTTRDVHEEAQRRLQKAASLYQGSAGQVTLPPSTNLPTLLPHPGPATSELRNPDAAASAADAPPSVTGSRGVRQSMNQQDLRISASLLHQDLQDTRKRMRAGDADASAQWIRRSEQLMNHFASVQTFFPKHARKQRRYREPVPAQEVIEVDESDESDDLESFGSDDGAIDITRKHDTTRTYQDLTMQDWLDVFCEYALETAKRGEKEYCFQALDIVGKAGPFVSVDSCHYHINVVRLTCALIFEDAEKLSRTVKWFAKAMPFEPDTYRLYNAVHRLCKSFDVKVYNAKSHLDFFRRQISLMDYALATPEERNSDNFHPSERAAALDPRKLATTRAANASEGNPYGITSINIDLLMLVGNMFASNGTHEEALHHYLRAYAADNAVSNLHPSPLLPLSIAISTLR